MLETRVIEASRVSVCLSVCNRGGCFFCFNSRIIGGVEIVIFTRNLESETKEKNFE